MLTDSCGRKTSFRHALLTLTSNISGEAIRTGEQLGFTDSTLNPAPKTAPDALRRHFSPEFLGRLDGVLWFQKLTPESLSIIAGKLLTELQRRLERMKIHMEFTAQAVQLLANAPKTAQYGARPMKSYLMQTVENPLADKILHKEIVSGDAIRLTAEKDSFVVRDKAAATSH